MNIINSIWVEKYRPQKLEDLILPNKYKENFKNIIENKSTNHLLFYGPPGGGKSSLARILTSKNGLIKDKENNLLEFNGSSKSSRGIGFVDDVIEPFLQVPPSKEDKIKIVFIEEADKLSSDAFDSLRNIMDRYQISNSRFILVCNYISKIPEPIRSRCDEFSFKQISSDYIFTYAENILKSEEIIYNEQDIKYIIDLFFPDIRRIINALQRYSTTKKLVLEKDISLTNEKIVISNTIEIINCILNNNKQNMGKYISGIVEIVKDDYNLDYENIYSSLFFNSKVFTMSKIYINDYSIKHLSCLIPSMNYMAMIFIIIKSLTEYINLKK